MWALSALIITMRCKWSTITDIDDSTAGERQERVTTGMVCGGAVRALFGLLSTVGVLGRKV